MIKGRFDVISRSSLIAVELRNGSSRHTLVRTDRFARFSQPDRAKHPARDPAIAGQQAVNSIVRPGAGSEIRQFYFGHVERSVSISSSPVKASSNARPNASLTSKTRQQPPFHCMKSYQRARIIRQRRSSNSATTRHNIFPFNNLQDTRKTVTGMARTLPLCWTTSNASAVQVQTGDVGEHQPSTR
jgi:hypothetical protein